MYNLYRKIQQLFQSDNGATMVEYALVMLLLILVSVTLIATIGGITQSLLNLGASL